MLTLAANYLVPSAGFLLELLLFLALFVIWPLAQAVRAGQAVWAVVIVVFAPLGAFAWWLNALWGRTAAA